jgi:hypothetical protein
MDAANRPKMAASPRRRALSMKEKTRQEVVESSLFLFDLSGRIFDWAQAIRHNEDATMRLLHDQQCEAADECRRMATKLRKLME